MYNNNKILAIIPARGGSKGIPHKNIIELAGKPLVSYTIEVAIKSRYIDYVMVSTDDESIAEISKSYGADVPFLRPAALASDTSKTLDTILHVIRSLADNGQFFDDLIILQPTNPLRTVRDVDSALDLYYVNGRKGLVSVSEVNDNPILMRTIVDNKLSKLLMVTSTCRRQDMPKYYRVNGCIYINAIEEIDENTSFNDNMIPFVMDNSHSVDIDDPSDLVLADYYMNKH